MRERLYPVIILLFLFQGALAQAPVIQKVERISSFPKTNIVISGSGFSSTSSQLQVWFDQVKGTIISSSDFSIEVEVPAAARLSNITVVNLSSRLSGHSKLKYMPVYSGEGFDPAKLETKTYTGAKPLFDINSVDFDGDNKPDIIGTSDDIAGSLGATSLFFLLNQSSIGNIDFNPVAIPSLTVNSATGFLAVGDLNLDGKPDVVASRSGTTSNSIYIFTNTSTVGNPNFSTPLVRILDIVQGAREVGIADLNGDGKPEIVVTNSTTNDIHIFKNESTGGNLVINPTPTKIAVTGASETLGLELQDMDGDGKTDIVVSKFQKSDIFILKNVSTPSAFVFSNITKITVPGFFNDITTADFNRDGKLDIVTTSLFTSQAVLLMNNSSNTAFSFATPIVIPTDAEPFGVDVSDMNGDGFPDFIIPCRGAKSLNVFLHNGNTTSVGFTKVVVPTVKTNWLVRAGDLDGDAKPDLAFTSFTPSTGPFTIDVLRNRNCHKPQIQNVPPLTICPAQTIRLTTIPIPGVTFNWSNGFSSIKNGADPFVDITAAATYTVTASGEGTACAVVSAPILVQSGAGTLPADPTITTNAPVCEGTTLNLGAPSVSGATYSWTGPNNFTSSVQNPSISSATTSNAGIYALTVKVGDCSSNTITRRIDVVTFGSFAISSSSASNSFCQGQSLTLSVNSQPGYSYQWIKDGVNMSGQNAATLVVTAPGSYKVNVSNTTLGCSQETLAVSVGTFAIPVSSFAIPASACVGSTISFTNNSVTDANVPASSVIYAWEFGDNATSNLKEPTHTYTSVQAFVPKLTVSYDGITGCSSSITKNINIVNGISPEIIATNSELCTDGSITSILSVTGTFTSYTWSTNETTSSIVVNAPGEYSVETEDATCVGSASITIDQKSDCSTAPISIPSVFTPNGDSQNDFWIIPGIEDKQDCTMNIFDGRGRRIYQKTGFPIAGWNGLSDENKEVPQGTYYFVFSCPSEPVTTGSVLVVR